MTILDSMNSAAVAFWNYPAVTVLEGCLEWLFFLWYVAPLPARERGRWQTAALNVFFLAECIALQLQNVRVSVHFPFYMFLWISYIWLMKCYSLPKAILKSSPFGLCMELCRLLCRDGLLTALLSQKAPWLSDLVSILLCVSLYLILLCLSVWFLRRSTHGYGYLELSVPQLLGLLFPLFLHVIVRQMVFAHLDMLDMTMWLWMELLQIGIAVCAEIGIVTIGDMVSAQMERNDLLEREMLVEKQRQQYLEQKGAVEAVNRRYHDLKHYIAAVEALREETERTMQAEQPGQAERMMRTEQPGQTERMMRTEQPGQTERTMRAKRPGQPERTVRPGTLPDKWKEIDSYIAQMRREIEPWESMQKTGNETMDILLAERIGECQRKGICLVPYVDGRHLDFLQTIDLCVIFGNAMDNAIEATEKLRYVNMKEISVKIGVSDQMLILRFRNYYEGTLRCSGGKLITGKADAEGHGYGMDSIREVVARYGGTVGYETEKQEFSLNILIPLPV